MRPARYLLLLLLLTRKRGLARSVCHHPGSPHGSHLAENWKENVSSVFSRQFRVSRAVDTCMARGACHLEQNLQNGSFLQWNTRPQIWSKYSEIIGFSSVASTDVSGKDGDSGSCVDEASPGEEVDPVSNPQAQTEETSSSSDSDTETDELDSGKAGKIDVENLEKDDLLVLLREREALVEEYKKLIAEMKDKVLRTYADAENTRERARREAESIKKYAIQNFLKSLLDVADNLGRAPATVPESVRNGDPTGDPSSTAKLLKTLLEGVEMTEKQLMQVFKKHGVEKFDPVGQPFDPNQHLALFEMEDASKSSGT
eukprot:c28565_g5_i1 orf=151-1092(+)